MHVVSASSHIHQAIFLLYSQISLVVVVIFQLPAPAWVWSTEVWHKDSRYRLLQVGLTADCFVRSWKQLPSVHRCPASINYIAFWDLRFWQICEGWNVIIPHWTERQNGHQLLSQAKYVCIVAWAQAYDIVLSAWCLSNFQSLGGKGGKCSAPLPAQHFPCCVGAVLLSCHITMAAG